MADTLKDILKRLLAGVRLNPAAKPIESKTPPARVLPPRKPSVTDSQPEPKQENRKPNPPPPRKSKAPRRHTRSGIPVIDPSEDLHRLFADSGEVQQEEAPKDTPPAFIGPEPAAISSEASAQGRQSRNDKRAWSKDRHGIPILNQSDALADCFREKRSDPTADAEFSRLVDKTLSSADYQEMIRAKKAGPQAGRKSNPKKRPRFLPPPRAELDLHGCTAEQGERKAEAFIRSSRSKGLDAIRIIVGRGLHSEGGAVLPNVVEDLVAALKKQGVVDYFDWEGGKKSRSGAILVYPAAMD